MIPNHSTLSRYVSFSKHHEGRPNGVAFRLDPGEEGLSTNWLERHAGSNTNERLSDLASVFPLKLRQSAIFSIHNKEELVGYVARETHNQFRLIVENDGDPIPSHSLVKGYTHDDEVIADLIAETSVEGVFVKEILQK